MDSSDEEQTIAEEDVLCKYGTQLTPYEAGKFQNFQHFNHPQTNSFIFR
jgi:hypothetical protein